MHACDVRWPFIPLYPSKTSTPSRLTSYHSHAKTRSPSPPLSPLSTLSLLHSLLLRSAVGYHPERASAMTSSSSCNAILLSANMRAFDRCSSSKFIRALSNANARMSAPASVPFGCPSVSLALTLSSVNMSCCPMKLCTSSEHAQKPARYVYSQAHSQTYSFHHHSTHMRILLLGLASTLMSQSFVEWEENQF